MRADLDASFSRLAELVTRSDAFPEILQVVKGITETAKLPGASLRSGTMFYRGRINAPGKSFSHRGEISYIRDIKSITRYGRANRPGTSLFYCSDDMMTAFLETVDSRLRENANAAGSVTVGCWRAVCPIKNISGVVNSSFALTKMFPPDSEAGKVMQILRDNKDRWKMELWSKALDYQVARFSERVSHHLQYQITSAIFEALVGDSLSGGIAYPSVLSEELGINYALTPVTCDTRLKLVDVLRIDFEKAGESVEMRERVSDHFSRNGNFRFHA